MRREEKQKIWRDGMKTLTAVVTDVQKIEYVEQDLPKLGEHELLIRMDSVGL